MLEYNWYGQVSESDTPMHAMALLEVDKWKHRLLYLCNTTCLIPNVWSALRLLLHTVKIIHFFTTRLGLACL